MQQQAADLGRTATGPGRPRAFNEDDVRTEAMFLFWTKGYANTTIRDLSEVTGLSASSLYATFGSKEDLLVSSLARYLDIAGAVSWRRLHRGTGGLADFAAYFDLLQTLANEHPRRGCLAARSRVELGLPPAAVALANQHREELDAAIAAAMQRAVDLGELSPEINVVGAARRISILVVAYLAMVGSPAPASDALELLDQAREVAGLR